MKPNILFWFCLLVPLTAGAGSKNVEYAGSPNHREMAVRAFALACEMGFNDPTMSISEIRSRLEAGAYSEDYEPLSVKLAIHDLLGREVAVLVNEVKAPGKYEATCNAGGMATGVYVCRVTAGSFASTRKMVLVR